jgi:serine/threonine protein kinase
LVGERGEPRLADFGLTEMSATEDVRRPPGNCYSGSLRWMAPELHQEWARKSRKADIYAFGMLIIEVCKPRTSIYIRCAPGGSGSSPQSRELIPTPRQVYTGRPPFTEDGIWNDGQILARVTLGGRLIRPSSQINLPDAVWDLVQLCWCHDPGARPTCREVLITVSCCSRSQ